MTDETRTESWGTSGRYDDGRFDDGDDGRHALPAEPAADARPTSSYGTFLEHPPYNTELAAMTVDVPDQPSVSPRPQPVPGRPSPDAPQPDPGQQETVTCPECGSTQRVNLNRRAATDFCRRCDFPLFWVPARTTRDWNPNSEREALRRLPGTGGSQRLASVACPHCAELNYATAVTCVRCGQSMHVQAPPPPPAPAPYVPPPVYEPEPEPERGVPWWVWLLVGTVLVAIVVVVLFVTGVLG
jgi:hypothetical protein